MPQVFVSGTWRATKAEAYRDQALELGRKIAGRGFDLACGPGTGIARHVIDGYIQVENRAKVRYYLPRQELMDAVGETTEPGADLIEITPFDYAMRNVYQISLSDGLFILTGGDGALEEALPALIDYELPVAVVAASGPAALALELLTGPFPEWRDRLTFGAQVLDIIDDFLDRVEAEREKRLQSDRPRAYHPDYS